MLELVCEPGEISVDWMNQALQEAGCLDKSSVSALEYALIGTGKMGDNARLTLSYEGERGSAPKTVIGKFPAADETARAMAAGGGAYYNEVMFYRELAPRTSMRTPHIFAAEVSEDHTEFVLLMEDLAPAEPGNNLVGESQQRSRLVLAEAAKLAAAFYDQDIGAKDHVMSGGRDDGGAFGQALMEDSWPKFLARFGAELSADCIQFGDQFVANYSRFATRRPGPKTLAHGDLRSENILFLENSATVVDWQTPGEAGLLTDAAYFLGGSLEVGDRRAWEQSLVAHYRDLLSKQGMQLSEDDCWAQYREEAMHGILIIVLGATFSEPAERSDKMFLTLIQRHLQHCVDMNSADFL